MLQIDGRWPYRDLNMWSLKNVERAGEETMVLWRCNVSAKDTHRAQKRGRIKPLFWPRYAHAHIEPYPGSTSVRPTTVPHSFSLLYPPHLPLPYNFHSLTPVLHSPYRACRISPSHLPPSVPLHATSTSTCVTPTASSQPPCLFHLAITHQVACHRVNRPARPSSTSTI
jgi:hypothetical protein